jgi:hypothetical protein
MAWIPLSQDDIQNSLTQTEQNLMASDPTTVADLAAIVSSVMGLVRGKVNAAKRNQGHLGPSGTIPDELYAASISIARYKFLSHLPQNQLMAADREQDKLDAYAQLDACAKGELVIARYDDPNGQSPEPGSDYGGEEFFEPYPACKPGGFPYVGGYW